MNMNTNSILSDLLNVKDGYAYGNLYTLEFLDTNNKEFSGGDSILTSIKYRGDAFTIPERSVETITLPWQGTQVEIETPISRIEKKISFSILMDSNMSIYNTIISKFLPVTFDGIINENYRNEKFNILVRTYKSEAVSALQPTYGWLFEDCRIVKSGQLSFTYNSSGALSFPFDFIYKTYACGNASYLSSNKSITL